MFVFVYSTDKIMVIGHRIDLMSWIVVNAVGKVREENNSK